MAQQLRRCLAGPRPMSEYLDWSPSSASDSSSLQMQTLAGSTDGLSGWVLAIHMGDLDCVLGSWLPSQPVDVVGIWEMNWQMGAPSLSLK